MIVHVYDPKIVEGRETGGSFQGLGHPTLHGELQANQGYIQDLVKNKQTNKQKHIMRTPPKSLKDSVVSFSKGQKSY